MTTTTSQYEKFFDEMDADGSGSVSMEEMKELMIKKGGYNAGSLSTMFGAADVSGDGKITRKEFLTTMSCASPEEIKAAMWRRAFNLFDEDKSGKINKSELEKVLEEAGKDFNEDEISRMMAMVDSSGDDQITYEEFIERFTKMVE